jgi:hypothetical protein
VQLFVHAWDPAQSAWTAEPVAFTQGTVTPRRLVNGTLFLIVPKGKSAIVTSQNAALPAGKYLIKAYVDSKHRLADDPAILLGPDDFVGQALLEARWREGFPQAEQISAARLER